MEIIKPEPAKTEAEIETLWNLTQPGVEKHAKTILDGFAAKTRHPEESFHNSGHSERFWKISEKLLGSEVVEEELNKYAKEKNLDPNIMRPLDLKIAFFMLAYLHDFGNSHSAVKTENGQIQAIPLQDEEGFNQFQKTDAESRSRAIAPEFISHYLAGVIDDPARIDRITKLTDYLIECTIYKDKPSEEKPFECLVQAIDQSLHTIPESEQENLKILLGLLSEEMHDPKGPQKNRVNPEYLIEFPALRLPIIIPNPDKRQKILALTGPLADFTKAGPNDPRFEEIRKHPIFRT